MATLVLTVAGGLIGGPAGAALGASLGSVIDHSLLFPPKSREGARLADLRVQSSSYGTRIPQLFGTMRVAGSVIWSTDLIEHRTHQSGGKGQPGVTSYSYTASFAVALSARPVLSIGRIWADGKLLRGAAGDFKTRTGFRLHAGGEAQEADPLIAAAEGSGLAPAHRGLAYVMFEDLELADFGNRIPSLTLEVTADPGPVTIDAIARELGGGLIAGETLAPLDGFSADGESLRGVIGTLVEAGGAWTAPVPGGLMLRSGPGAARTLADSGARRDRTGQPVRTRAIAAADNAPVRLTLAHYDPARDYQAGVQQAVRPGPGARAQRIELPAAIGAGAAKTLAEAALARREFERERRTLSLGSEGLDLAPGDRIAVAGEPGLWRVDQANCEALVVTLDCVRVASAPLPAEASGGRAATAEDHAIGATLVSGFELMPLDDGLASAPRLAIAAAGTGAGWRRAALLVSTDSGARWDPAGSTALPAILGTVVTPPGPGPVLLVDRAGSLTVELAQDAMLLADADDAALDGGANLAIAGEELLQFARAEPIGGRRWKLSGLWRGRRGTEYAIGSQTPGDAFILLGADMVTLVDLPLASIGATAEILAQGAGDGPEGVHALAMIDGRSVLPPAPVHLRAATHADGTTTLSWVRRSRAGWRWVDGVDAPLGEEREAWRVTIEIGASVRTVDCTTASLLLDAADRGAECRVEIRQVGSFGLSRAATITLPPL